MNSATAGTRPNQKDRRTNQSRKGFVFRTPGVVTVVGLVDELAKLGLTLCRAHQKPAAGKRDAQVMFVFVRNGKPELTPPQVTELVEQFLGTADAATGFTHVVSMEKYDALAAGPRVHTAMPEHAVLTCSGATRRNGAERELEFHSSQKRLLSAIEMVRLAVNLPAEIAATIPAWVPTRDR